MLILNEEFGSIVSVTTRWRDRVHARLYADRIDRDLAAGSSPDAGVPAALRARRLTDTRYRYSLAAGLERVVSEALTPSAGSIARLPMDRARVLNSLDELRELHAALIADGPVAPRGVALTKLFLTAGSGPLRGRGDGADVRRAVRRATDALSIFATDRDDVRP
ncbi:MAG: hypothetical protein JWM76_739 [Pseudonocardiales bacterium]|nr:hypothetical protein [Pseudonocardiales bacterium]